MKVGQLAAMTGLTVRTLHHYDEIGLLSPGRRTSAGHRIYGEAEVKRLQQIASLRHLGLGLDEIRGCLDGSAMTLEGTLELHLERIDEEIEQRSRLRDLIEDLRNRLRDDDGVSVEDLIRTIAVTVDYRRYYTPEQLARLRARATALGPERIQEAESEWKALLDAFGQAMDRGLPAGAEEVGELARRAVVLVREFTGGDPATLESLSAMYRHEGADRVMKAHGMPMKEGLWEYMAEARASLEK